MCDYGTCGHIKFISVLCLGRVADLDIVQQIFASLPLPLWAEPTFHSLHWALPLTHSGNRILAEVTLAEA